MAQKHSFGVLVQETGAEDLKNWPSDKESSYIQPNIWAKPKDSCASQYQKQKAANVQNNEGCDISWI